MSLRMAVLYEDGEVYVEFPPDEFRKLVSKYYRKHKSIPKTFKAIEFDLKQKTRYK